MSEYEGKQPYRAHEKRINALENMRSELEKLRAENERLEVNFEKQKQVFTIAYNANLRAQDNLRIAVEALTEISKMGVRGGAFRKVSRKALEQIEQNERG